MNTLEDSISERQSALQIYEPIRQMVYTIGCAPLEDSFYRRRKRARRMTIR